MKCRLIAFAAAASLLSSTAYAEPPKAPATDASQAETAAKDVVLASADAVQSPSQGPAQQASSAPKRPRAARVTTCRCGDPQQAAADQ